MTVLRRSVLALVAALPVALTASDALAQTFPRFSNPTNITNPFLPVSNARHSVTLGLDEGLRFRSEETLLPGTRAITWAGGTTLTRVQQFTAYLDGELVEVAYDFYAQADNGDVYYFGEDVFNYEDGEIINTNGTWRAGRDGAPPGLIMPAHPTVGQVFNSENFFPLVFEEDTVLSLTEPTRTPRGTIANGLLIHELLLDNSEEFKVYAAGFGQVEGREIGAQTNQVLFNSMSAPFGRVPRALDDIESRADDVLRFAPNWRRARSYTSSLERTWAANRARITRDGAPTEFITDLDSLITQLRAAVDDRDLDLTREISNDVRAAAVELVEYYNPRLPADVTRLQVLQAEIRLDTLAGDWVAARGEYANAVDAVWARLRPFVVLRRGGLIRAAHLDSIFAALGEAIADQDEETALNAIRRAHDITDELEEIF